MKESVYLKLVESFFSFKTEKLYVSTYIKTIQTFIKPNAFLLKFQRNFSNNGFTDDENRQYIKDEGISVADNRNSIGTLPGIYPTYTTIPRTGFSCKEKLTWHYYTDTETDCQVKYKFSLILIK